MVLESRKAILTLLIIAITALILVLFTSFRAPESVAGIAIGDLSGPLRTGENFVVVEMPAEKDRVAVPETEVALFTNARDGFLALILNCKVIAVSPVGERREIELPRFAAVRPTSKPCTGSKIENFPAEIKTSLVRFVPDGDESYLADIKIPLGKNILSAVLLNQEFDVLAQHTVSFDGAPEGTVAPLGDGIIANVTFNGTTIAVLNNTEYRVKNQTLPTTVSVTITNGTHNVTYNITSIGGLWLRTIFQDVAAVPAEFSDWRWVQVVTTNLKIIDRAAQIGQFFDPPISYVDFVGTTDDGQPYYYNDADHAIHRHTLIDHPTRPKVPSSSFTTVTWSAEACHVGVKAGPDTILSCFTYGFSIGADGTVTLHPITSTGTGTANFKNTVNGAHPGSVS